MKTLNTIALRRLATRFCNGTSAEQVDEGQNIVTRIETISKGVINYDKTGYLIDQDTAQRYKLDKGDIVISNINSLEMVGNHAIYDGKRDLYHGMNLIRITPNKGVNSRYLSYNLTALKDLGYFSSIAKPAINQASIPASQLKQTPIIIADKEKQDKVADTLDVKVKTINQIIEKKQKLIDLLQEKRTAIIINAVTKGLDSKVKMKDSGVEWIRNLPDTWGVKKYKYFSTMKYGSTLPDEKRVDGEIGVYGSNGKVGTHNHSNTYSPVIIVGRKGSFGAINYVNNKVYAIDTTYYIDKTCTTQNLKWLSYVMSSANINDISNDTGVPGLSRAKVYNQIFPLPSISVQERISNYLDGKTATLSDSISKINQQILLLAEYRSSLIYHAVTGKIKV